MALTTRPLASGRLPDLEAVFLAKGCSMARGCWCMSYRGSGKVEAPAGVRGIGCWSADVYLLFTLRRAGA